MRILKKFPIVYCLFFYVLLVCGISAIGFAQEDSVDNSNPTQSARSSKGTKLQFAGIVQPGKKMAVVLLPGEGIRQVLVKSGDKVEEGAKLLELSNVQLISGLVDLQQRKNSVKQSIEKFQLIKLEHEIKLKQLDVIDGEIAREKQLSQKIEGYVSTMLLELQKQNIQLSNEITLLNARIIPAAERAEEAQRLLGLIEEQIALTRQQIDKLVVHAPFSGKVNYAVEDPDRVQPGGLICVIWDDSSYIIRGIIMQHQLSLINPGDEVSVSVDFLPDKTVTGHVRAIRFPMQRPEGQGYPGFEVSMKVEGHQSLFEPGMTVSITKTN